jgi:hypothetical protein
MALPASICVAFVDGEDANYRALLPILAGQIRQRKVVPLLGAGASHDAPSHLALANKLINPLFNALWGAATPVIRRAQLTSEDLTKAKHNLEDARLERLLDALHQTHGSAALEYLSVLNGKSWNFNHGAIAALAQHGFLPWCITLNFDLLIEKAVEIRGVACETICPIVAKTFRIGTGLNCMRVVKPHGSFVPSDVSADFYAYLSTTLSQAGVRPATANIEAIQTILSECPVLLFGGYSDDDWDIFPIFARLKSKLQSIIWVHHVEGKEFEAWRQLPKEKLEPKWFNEKLISWLGRFGSGAVLVIGKLNKVLEDIMAEPAFAGLDMRIEQANESPLPLPPDATPFTAREPWTDPISIKTAISLAMLLQHTGNFSLALLDWLHGLPEVQGNLEFAWRIEHLLAHTEHTRNRVRFAIPHMKRVIELKSRLGKKPEELAADNVWFGYEYLCLAKRPNPMRPLSLISMPIHIFHGLQLMRKGVRTAGETGRYQQQAARMFYKVDLLHSWANILMLFGHRPAKLFRPYFWLVAKLYDRVANKFDLMSGDYHWLRHFEARLLAGRVENKEAAQQQLEEIERMNDLIQNNVQAGNTYVYRALLDSLNDGNIKPTEEAEKLLGKAKERWRRGGPNIESGRRRVILFQRFLFPKTISFGAALQEILREGKSS